jgi:UDP-3-O-[3-hydroxymyristoyl] glucosamine N-acyltransferase
MTIFSSICDGRVNPCDKKVLIYGNGPHTRVVYGYLFDENIISGFVVDDHVVHLQPFIGGMEVTPLSQVVERFPPQEYAVLVALGFRDFNGLRKDRTDALRHLGYQTVGFVDRSVRLPQSYSVETNCIIIDHVAVNDGVVIREGSFVSSGAMIGHDSVLGAYSWVGSGVALAGGVTVGDFSILGLNSSVKQNTELAHHTLVTANTFVNTDTKPYDAIASEAGKRLPFDSRKIMRFAYLGKNR